MASSTAWFWSPESSNALVRYEIEPSPPVDTLLWYICQHVARLGSDVDLHSEICGRLAVMSSSAITKVLKQVSDFLFVPVGYTAASSADLIPKISISEHVLVTDAIEPHVGYMCTVPVRMEETDPGRSPFYPNPRFIPPTLASADTHVSAVIRYGGKPATRSIFSSKTVREGEFALGVLLTGLVPCRLLLFIDQHVTTSSRPGFEAPTRILPIYLVASTTNTPLAGEAKRNSSDFQKMVPGDPRDHALALPVWYVGPHIISKSLHRYQGDLLDHISLATPTFVGLTKYTSYGVVSDMGVPPAAFLEELEFAISLRHRSLAPVLVSGADGRFQWFMYAARPNFLSTFIRHSSTDAQATLAIQIPGKATVWSDTSQIISYWYLLRGLCSVADGLEYLHGKGHVHGNLSPASVVIDVSKFEFLLVDYSNLNRKTPDWLKRKDEWTPSVRSALPSRPTFASAIPFDTSLDLSFFSNISSLIMAFGAYSS